MSNLVYGTATFTECLDAGFGHENNDGYVRICDKPRNIGGKLIMRHRWYWEVHNGPIPFGYEINHKCGNRRCFNLDHLELLEGRQHAILTNQNRYKQTIEVGIQMLNEGKSCYEIAEKLDRTVACVRMWKRKYLNT